MITSGRADVPDFYPRLFVVGMAELLRHILSVNSICGELLFLSKLQTFLSENGVERKNRLFRGGGKSALTLNSCSKFSSKCHLPPQPKDVGKSQLTFRDAKTRYLVTATAPDGDNLALFDQKIAYAPTCHCCCSLRSMHKLWNVLAEVRTGRYRRFSRSWKSAVQDLL